MCWLISRRLPGQVVDHRAGRRVRHPDLIVRIAGGDPGRHPHEVVDRQVIYPRRVDPGEDALSRVRRDQIEAADLVIGPVGAGADDVAGHGCEVHGLPLLAKAAFLPVRASARDRRGPLCGRGEAYALKIRIDEPPIEVGATVRKPNGCVTGLSGIIGGPKRDGGSSRSRQIGIDEWEDHMPSGRARPKTQPRARLDRSTGSTLS